MMRTGDDGADLAGGLNVVVVLFAYGVAEVLELARCRGHPTSDAEALENVEVLENILQREGIPLLVVGREWVNTPLPDALWVQFHAIHERLKETRNLRAWEPAFAQVRFLDGEPLVMPVHRGQITSMLAREQSEELSYSHSPSPGRSESPGKDWRPEDGPRGGILGTRTARLLAARGKQSRKNINPVTGEVDIRSELKNMKK